MYKVGLLGLARRAGTFAEVGLRSWEEAGCAAVERALLDAAETPFVVYRPLVIRSSQPAIETLLRDWCDVPNADARCDLILTVGGTGLTPADILPEATAAVIQRPIPGLRDLLLKQAPTDPAQALPFLRGMAGLRGQTVIVNLPGAVTGLASGETLTLVMEALLPLLPVLLRAVRETDGDS